MERLSYFSTEALDFIKERRYYPTMKALRHIWDLHGPHKTDVELLERFENEPGCFASTRFTVPPRRWEETLVDAVESNLGFLWKEAETEGLFTLFVTVLYKGRPVVVGEGFLRHDWLDGEGHMIQTCRVAMVFEPLGDGPQRGFRLKTMYPDILRAP